MAGIIDVAEIELPCKNCGRKTKKSIGWIKTHNDFTCACGTKILLDTAEIRREVSNFDGGYDAMQAQIKKLHKG